MYPSLHILGNRRSGGSEQFYIRLVRSLHEAGEPVVAVNRRGSRAAEALRNSGIELLHLPLANGWDFWSAWRIRRLALSRQPCIVQTYLGRATRLTRLPRKSGAVHIARLGGFYKIDGYYRHAHAWIGNTRAICDYLVESGIPASRVFYIGNFVPDAEPATPEQRRTLREQHAIPDDALVVFALGRLIGKKGFADLLQACAMLPETLAGRPLRLLIAGDGPERHALEALGNRLGIGERVRWLGWRQPAEFYALADLLVCPARHEPLGNVILEAWSYALPVVSTATDAPLELIESEATGLLCPPDDPAALAGKIREVLTAPEKARHALGEAGHRVLCERYGRAAVLGAYLDLYRTLLAERGL